MIRRQHLIDFAQIIKSYPLVLKRDLSWRMMMSTGLYMICYQSVRNLIFQWFWIIIIIILSLMPIELGRDEGYHGLISKNSCRLDAKEYYSQNALLRTYPAAITGRQRRKHNSRVATFPLCPPTMDLMIEAKDKEQAVFELMRTFKLPGFNTFSNMIPHMRKDKNKKIISKPIKKTIPKANKIEEEKDNNYIEQVMIPVAEKDIGMGGPEGRVYWPPGMEHWLRPAKRVVKASPKKTTLNKRKSTRTSAKKKRKALEEEEEEADDQQTPSPNDIVTVRKPVKRARTALTSSSAKEKVQQQPKRRRRKRTNRKHKVVFFFPTNAPFA